MKITAIDSIDEKSIQEREEEMLNKQAIESQNIEIKEDLIETDKVLDDGDVMSFLSKKYGMDFKSLDDLVKDREPREEYPEDVQAFAKYKKETGRN